MRGYLRVVVEPGEGEVGDADGLPVIGDLLTGAIDDPGDLIGDDELQVLGDEEGVEPEQRIGLPRRVHP